jgi:hypothetical protein
MKKFAIIVLSCVAATGVMAETAGFQLSLIPDVAIQERDTTIKGVSIGVWNENPGSQWQIGFVNGMTGESYGVQGPFFWTIFNYAEDFTGAQLGLVNYVSKELTGAQLGAVNVVKAVDGGFQLGFVNYTETAKNLLQIGFVNIIEDNEWFSDFPSDLAKGFVIVNWTFGE